MSLEELRARVLASMKKREEIELEEGEVSAPPPVLSSAPSAGISAGRREVEPQNPMMGPPPDERVMRSPSPASDPPRRSHYPLQLDDAWEQDEMPRYQPSGGYRGGRGVRGRSRAGMPGTRGRGRGAGWPNPRPGRYRGEASSNPPPLANELPTAAAPGLEQLSLEEMASLLQLAQQLVVQQQAQPAAAVPASYNYLSTAELLQPYDPAASSLYAQNAMYYGTDANSGVAAAPLDPQGAEAYARLAALLHPETGALSAAPAPADPESDATKFLSLMAMQVGDIAPSQPPPAALDYAQSVPATATASAPQEEAEEDMEVEPAQTLGRIILANPQPTAAAGQATAPKPQRLTAVKAPAPPKPSAAHRPAPAAASDATKPRAPSAVTATTLAAPAAPTPPVISRVTIQKHPSTRTLPSESSLVILLDSASEDEASDTNAPNVAQPLSAPAAPVPASAVRTASIAAAVKGGLSLAVKSAAKPAASISEIERLRQLIAQKERELEMKKRPAEEDTASQKKAKPAAIAATNGATNSASSSAIPGSILSISAGPSSSPSSPVAPAATRGHAGQDVPMDMSSPLQDNTHALAAPPPPFGLQQPLAAPASPLSAISHSAALSSSHASPSRRSAQSSPSQAQLVYTSNASPSETYRGVPLSILSSSASPVPPASPVLPQSSAPSSDSAPTQEPPRPEPLDTVRMRFVQSLVVPALADAKKVRAQYEAAVAELADLEARLPQESEARQQATRQVEEKKEELRLLDLQLVDLLFELRLTSSLRQLRASQDFPIRASVASMLKPILRHPPTVLATPAPVTATAMLTQLLGHTPPGAHANGLLTTSVTVSSTNNNGNATNTQDSAVNDAKPSPTPLPSSVQYTQTPTPVAAPPALERAPAAPQPSVALQEVEASRPPTLRAVSPSDLVTLLDPEDPCCVLLDIATSPFALLNAWHREHAKREEQEHEAEAKHGSAAAMAQYHAPVMHAASLPSDYDSPLLALRSYRLQPIFPKRRTSPSFGMRLDPRIVLCRFELSGACNDPACRYQHLRDVCLTGDALAADYASYASLVAPSSSVTPEEVLGLARASLGKRKTDAEALIDAVLMQLYALRRDHRLLLSGRPPYEMPNKKKRVRKAGHDAERSDSDDEDGEEKEHKRDSEGYMALAGKAVGGGVSGCGGVEKSKRGVEEARYWKPSVATSDFEAMLAASPHDIELWLRFAKDRGPGDDGLRVLARALEHNKHSTELWLAYLRLFLRMRSWQPEAAQLALDAVRFNGKDIRIVRLAAQLARTVPAAIAILCTGAKAMGGGTSEEYSRECATLLLTAAEALVSQGNVGAAQRLLQSAAFGTTLTDSVAGEEALCSAAAPLAQHEAVLLLLCACQLALSGHMPLFPGGAPALFRVAWVRSTPTAIVACMESALADARLSGGSSAAASALWANVVELQRVLDRMSSAQALAKQATVAAPTVMSRWIMRAKLEELSGQFASAVSVLDEAILKDPPNAARYSLHSCVLRVLGGMHSPREVTQELATGALALPTTAEEARSAFLSALALDAELAPLPLPASDDVYVWLSFALTEALRAEAEAEQVRAVFTRALAQLRTETSRRIVRNEYLCWLVTRPAVNGRAVFAELERVTPEMEGLAVAVQFIAAASAQLSAVDALALYERAAYALGDSAAMAMLALRCLDSNLRPTEVERVRQLVSGAAAANPFETTLWLALVRCTELYKKDSLLLQTRAAMERAHPRFVAILDSSPQAAK